jgi:hypothetical protein
MPQSCRRQLALGLLALLPLGTGCMPGMTYRIPMPSSLTFGTIRSDDATLASESRIGRQIKSAKPTEGGSSDVAMVMR